MLHFIMHILSNKQRKETKEIYDILSIKRKEAYDMHIMHQCYILFMRTIF